MKIEKLRKTFCFDLHRNAPLDTTESMMEFGKVNAYFNRKIAPQDIMAIRPEESSVDYVLALQLQDGISKQFWTLSHLICRILRNHELFKVPFFKFAMLAGLAHQSFSFGLKFRKESVCNSGHYLT